MSFIEDALVGKKISAVLVDSEVMYIMLTNGTQITIKGVIAVEPRIIQPSGVRNPAVRDSQ
jgi:hypothetical protein